MIFQDDFIEVESNQWNIYAVYLSIFFFLKIFENVENVKNKNKITFCIIPMYLMLEISLRNESIN